MLVTREQIVAMSFEERDQLLETIWDVMDSISHPPYADNAEEESAEELLMLQEEMAEYERNPASAKSWEEVLQELRSSIHG